MPSTPSRAAIAAAALAACAAQAQTTTITIQGHYDNAVGSSDAASQGVVTSTLVQSRPTLRPAEVLEFVPGMIVTQHSGDGKANQYFLRGFNLDHGTDFAVFVDGMPVNLPSHAHGQGYADLNFLMPELVEHIHYRTGPYYADQGDFSAAGAAHLHLRRSMPAPIAELTAGSFGYRRALVAGNRELAGANLLGALEVGTGDGPWEHPEDLRKVNALLRYARGTTPTGFRLLGWRTPRAGMRPTRFRRARWTRGSSGASARSIRPMAAKLRAIASRRSGRGARPIRQLWPMRISCARVWISFPTSPTSSTIR